MPPKLSASKSLIALSVFALSSSASATEFNLKLEPGVAIPLNDPQRDHYVIGFGMSVKGLFGVTPYWDIGPAISTIVLPADGEGDAGTAWMYGAGLRLKRPHDRASVFGLSPWIDTDFYYARTGKLDRPAFDVALGLSVPIGQRRHFWIGPFVRYTQIFQIDRTGYENGDAKLLTIGLSLEFGTGVKLNAKGEVIADRDGDGIPDDIDHCPDRFGLPENFGCPVYRTVIVREDRLELKEKLYFEWDKSNLEEVSFPVLDELAEALNDHQGIQVEIDGNTDSTGSEEHNQTLSEDRANTVLNYLVDHGVARDRLVAKGFASTKPADSNVTPEGRENNRRVEFVVHFAFVKVAP